MQSKITASEYFKGVSSIVLVTAIYGLYGVITRFLNADFSIEQQVLLRMGIAAVAAFIIFNRYIDTTKLRLLPAREWGLLVLRGLSAYAFGVLLFSHALVNTTLVNASLISVLPLIPVVGILFFKEKPSAIRLVCTAGAFMGAFLVAAANLHEPFTWGKGDFLALLSLIGFTIALVGRKWHSEILNNREITAFMLLFGFIGVFTYGLLQGEIALGAISWSPLIVVLLVAGGLFNVLSLLLTNYAFTKLSNVLAGNLLTLEVVFSMVFGFFLYAELLTLQQLLGALIIVGSILGLNYEESKIEATD